MLTAQLDPARREVRVFSVAPLRDIAPGSVPDLVRVLQQWSARCDDTLAELEATMAEIRADAAAVAEQKREAAGLVDMAAEGSDLDGKGKGRGGVGGLRSRGARKGLPRAAAKRGMVEIDAGEEDEDYEAMELDDEGGEGKQKLARRRKL